MEKGIIFTKDNKELDVFFLKSQEPKEPPLEYHKNLTEFDTNENSAGQGAHAGCMGMAGNVGPDYKRNDDDDDEEDEEDCDKEEPKMSLIREIYNYLLSKESFEEFQNENR